ncbi:conjugal transfer protein [Carnobacterium mobile]|uniref:conjugal transfer protein n=1 Tax=Carnobacterium mobile TaxID=2750 RepID=UPI0005597EA9|nr:conjugal transfer protein [Carnobacterium mobile]
MKIHIERKPKKAKQQKIKKPKTMHIGTHKKSVLALWVLLLLSLAFGIYKNFPAVDQHTIHENKTIEPLIVDTHAIESFTINFIQDFYSWENKKEVIEGRSEAIKHYLTPTLQELNMDTIRSDIPTSSKVMDSQIWEIEPIDKQNYAVIYTVTQDIIEEKESKVFSSNYRLVIYQDDHKNLVITQNPTIWTIPEKSDYEPTPISSDSSVDSDTEKEILEFLETFFKLYPTASESELTYYVKENVLPVIGKNYQFSEVVDPIIQKNGHQYQVSLVVKYLNDGSKSVIVSQYDLILEKQKNWEIININNK